jgi:hypothetical protein
MSQSVGVRMVKGDLDYQQLREIVDAARSGDKAALEDLTAIAFTCLGWFDSSHGRAVTGVVTK